MRLAVMTKPVAAPKKVAARSLRTTKPRIRLRPSVEMATWGAGTAHQWASSRALAATKGTTRRSTSFDCHISLVWATLHRTFSVNGAEGEWREEPGESVYTHWRGSFRFF